MSVLGRIAEVVAAYGGREAFCIGGVFYSYDYFGRLVNGIVRALGEWREAGEVLVGLELRDDIYTYASIFGAYYSGMGFVPLNGKNPMDRNVHIINECGLKVVLSSVRESVYGGGVSGVCVVNSAEVVVSEECVLVVPEYAEENMAYVLFTSGSTGMPKGVPIRQRELDSFMAMFFGLGLRLDCEDKFLQMYDLSFDLSVIGYLAPLMLGACVYTVSDEGIKYMEAYRIIEDYGLTFLIFVPSVLTYLRSYFDDIRLEKVKYSLFCGEALYDELVEEWVRCTPFSEVLNTYGPTEATVFCFLYGWRASAVGEKSYQGMVSIGRALGSTEVLVVDEHLNGVGVGAKGELCLSGEQVTVGYWNNEEKNRQSFFVKDGRRYYRTGDLVFVDGDGDYMFCGRIDFQVKVNGYRVELSEIEHQVRVFTHSSQVVVVACERVGGGVVLVLFLEGYEGDIGLLLSYLRSKLPVYMIPSEVRVLEAFPLNKNGKVDRNELRRMVK